MILQNTDVPPGGALLAARRRWVQVWLCVFKKGEKMMERNRTGMGHVFFSDY